MELPLNNSYVADNRYEFEVAILFENAFLTVPCSKQPLEDSHWSRVPFHNLL